MNKLVLSYQFIVDSYLESALNSIFNQSLGLENLEVIMVNDCSSDNSGKIIDDYAINMLISWLCPI